MVGSNTAQTRFRIITVDRTEPLELIISENEVSLKILYVVPVAYLGRHCAMSSLLFALSIEKEQMVLNDCIVICQTVLIALYSYLF